MTNRRRFLGSAAFLAACGTRMGRRVEASGDEGPAARQSEGDVPIIDTHVHLWDLDRFRLPWLEGGGPLARHYLPDDYREAAEGLNVVRGVYMEVDVDPAQHVAEAEFVVDLCRRGVEPLVGAVIGGRPASDAFGTYLDRFRDSPEVKGVRQVLHGGGTPPGTCLEPEFIRGIRLLGERGLSFDLCMRPGELRDGARLVDACPDTFFILDHCGNPNVQAADHSAWRDDLARLAERENLVCKVSGIVASANPETWTPDDLAPIITHVLDCFGPDRVVFGGDWPVCTRAASLRQWTEALKVVVADRSLVNRKKLFHDNAMRVYRLAD
ncbi:amidohydrolase family protein [Tautonia marina]|uniref:amidohydrolase family protein n=1 Tax=Tautonia marina TaxID=2653855 RepID=UPI0012608759|nr:amidohydrolase family protein [Tautonia marina]